MEFDGLKMLGDLTIARTYAETKPNGKKETWNEIVGKYLRFMKETYPTFQGEIDYHGGMIKDQKVVPSMRLLQFSRVAALNHVRAYNCSYMNMDCFEAFRELPWLLACGAGVGVGLLRGMVDKLPEVAEGIEDFYCIEDSKEGWAYSMEYLMRNPKMEFGYDLIRPAGAPLSSGGTAGGAGPLVDCHIAVKKILQDNVGRKLKPIHILHIVCHIANAIVAGGVRRSALISLCSSDDIEVIEAKTGNWFETDIHLAKSNNSAVVFRDSPTAKEDFDRLLGIGMNGWGEPGVIWSNGSEDNLEDFQGVNPCVELSLRNCGLCNLSEVIASKCESREEFFKACMAAAFFGTLQAGLNNFPFLRDIWKKNAEEESLIGVSITGQAMAPNLMTEDILTLGAQLVNTINTAVAGRIGISPAKRTTCVKPSGSTSASLGCTSGIHAAHSAYFIRRIRTTKLSPLGAHLIAKYGVQNKGFVEQCVYSDKDIVLSVPCKMVGSVSRHEGVKGLLARVKTVTDSWINTGYREGSEKNNVSLTVSYTDDEKVALSNWMWDNRYNYRGVSILPYSGEYQQAPFEEISKDKYDELIEKCPNINVSEIVYDDASRMQVAACVGGSCEVSF